MAFDRDAFYREVGLRLQLARKRKGFTQDDIAVALKMPRASYANVESGRQRTALDVIWMIAAHLGVPLDTLVPEPVELPPSERSSFDGATGTAGIRIKSA